MCKKLTPSNVALFRYIQQAFCVPNDKKAAESGDFSMSGDVKVKGGKEREEKRKEREGGKKKERERRGESYLFTLLILLSVLQ